jgi:hypothetical protein
MKLNAADLMVIADTLNHSLRITNYSGFTAETRERTMIRVIDIMESMEVEIICGNIEPVIISGDVGG